MMYRSWIIRCLPFSMLCCLGLVGACEAGSGGGGGGGGGLLDATPPSMSDSSTPSGMDSSRPPAMSDAGNFDPFDPENACGVSTVPTSRVPGSLLIVFDRSGSMSDEVGSSTRWDLATAGMQSVLAGVSDELSAGLLLFPSDGDCGVDAAPAVPVAPLSTSRSQIMSTLAGTSPGGSTPAFAALLAGYDHLDTLTTPGQRGIVLVSDGGETCNFEGREEVFARVQREHDVNNRLTFAVGLDYADNNLSTIAYNGGTPRNDTCLPMCTSGGCLSDADCGGAPCVQPLAGVAGFCSCNSDADCVDPQTCMSSPGAGVCGLLPAGPARDLCEAANADRCTGDANCCHYNAAASDFRTEFETALGEIARRLLDSCVFDVPRGDDPSSFDPSLVNVGVTFDGEERNVLRQSSDGSVDSWNYTDPSNTSLLIQGPICDRLLTGESAVVEIVLGCPTILI